MLVAGRLQDEAGSGESAGAGDEVALAPGDDETFSAAAFNYYMKLWKLFYAAYLLLPVAL